MRTVQTETTMTKAAKGSTKSGITFTGLLTVVLVTLKLTGTGQVASWSWLWVLSPMLIGPAFIALCLALFLVVGAAVVATDWYIDTRKPKHRRWR